MTANRAPTLHRSFPHPTETTSIIFKKQAGHHTLAYTHTRQATDKAFHRPTKQGSISSARCWPQSQKIDTQQQGTTRCSTQGILTTAVRLDPCREIRPMGEHLLVHVRKGHHSRVVTSVTSVEVCAMVRTGRILGILGRETRSRESMLLTLCSNEMLVCSYSYKTCHRCLGLLQADSLSRLLRHLRLKQGGKAAGLLTAVSDWIDHDRVMHVSSGLIAFWV